MPQPNHEDIGKTKARGGGHQARGPLSPISFIFMQFSAKFCQVKGWRLQTLGLAPVWKILDPPLEDSACRTCGNVDVKSRLSEVSISMISKQSFYRHKVVHN